MESEIDCQGRGQCIPQFHGADHVMVAIGPHSLGGLDADEDHQGGESPTQEAKTGMPLPDVMDQCGHYDIGIRHLLGDYRQRCVVAVTLVDLWLGEEDVP